MIRTPAVNHCSSPVFIWRGRAIRPPAARDPGGDARSGLPDRHRVRRTTRLRRRPCHGERRLRGCGRGHDEGRGTAEPVRARLAVRTSSVSS